MATPKNSSAAKARSRKSQLASAYTSATATAGQNVLRSPRRSDLDPARRLLSLASAFDDDDIADRGEILEGVRAAKQRLETYFNTTDSHKGDNDLDDAAYDAFDLVMLVEAVLAEGIWPSSEFTVSPVRTALRMAAHRLSGEEARP